jgi:RHS repeat-associated protein
MRYEYNGQKQLAAIVLPDGQRFGFTYNVQDRLQAIAYPNGTIGRWTYDAAGRVEQITYADRHGTAIAGWTYHYDLAGNLVERQDEQHRTTRFRYDPAGQLTEEAGPAGTIRYHYLPGGNRATVEAGGTVIQYQYDAADRLLQASEERLSYDAHGHLVQRQSPQGTMRYEYDADGQLVKLVSASGVTTAFGYAPTGERVWKDDGEGRTYYLYDGLALLEEVGEDGTSRAAYVHAPGIDRPLAMWRDGQYYFYHADRLGSIALLTDSQGQVAAAYEYDAFGKLRAQQGAIPNAFTFTGREWDASTGLYYYRARYYDAGLGRFISTDPFPPRFEDPFTLNPYLYVRNNPVGLVDPLGLTWQEDAAWLVNELGEAVDEMNELTKEWQSLPPQRRPGWETDPNRGVRLNRLIDKVNYLKKELEQLRVRGPAGEPHRPPWSPPGGATGGAAVPQGRGPRGRGGMVLGPLAPLVLVGMGHDAITYINTPPPDKPHVGAQIAGGWIGGLGGPAIVGYCLGAPLGPLGSIAVGMGSSYLCSQLGGWWVPPGKPPASEPPPAPPPERTPEPKAAPPPPPPPGAVGGYDPTDPTKEPGMGGKPPDIAGATQAGDQRVGGDRPSGTEGSAPRGLGGGEVTRIPATEPPPDTPSGGREPQPAQGGGWWCYSEPAQQWYQVPMGPCPPSSRRPPRRVSPGDPGVRIPHDTLQPGPGMGDKPAKPGKPMAPGTSSGTAGKPAGPPGKPMGPQPACGPATSCRCAGGGMGHIPCDKAKGACHCGEG